MYRGYQMQVWKYICKCRRRILPVVVKDIMSTSFRWSSLSEERDQTQAKLNEYPVLPHLISCVTLHRTAFAFHCIPHILVLVFNQWTEVGWVLFCLVRIERGGHV